MKMKMKKRYAYYEMRDYGLFTRAFYRWFYRHIIKY